MIALHRVKTIMSVALGTAAMLLAGCASVYPGKTVGVTLSGGEEVPPVATAATATGVITVNTDLTVSGTITVAGIDPIAAHIHVGARGTNGPIAVGLVKTADNVWALPPGAAFNDAQYKAFYAGDTYINVHTEAHKGGEIRTQLQP